MVEIGETRLFKMSELRFRETLKIFAVFPTMRLGKYCRVEFEASLYGKVLCFFFISGANYMRKCDLPSKPCFFRMGVGISTPWLSWGVPSLFSCL